MAVLLLVCAPHMGMGTLHSFESSNPSWPSKWQLSNASLALPLMLFPAMLGSGSQEGYVALHAQAFLEVTSWYIDSGMDHCHPFGYEDSRTLWREESWQTCLPPAPPVPSPLIH